MINGNFWSGKRVFLTGHTGFKGSWLSTWLLELGAEVHGYALAPETDPSLFHLLQLKMKTTTGDIRDLNGLSKAMKDFSPHIVLHLAAQPLVRKSYQDPVDTYSTNVMGTVNVLEACRFCPDLKVIINVTTDKVYENKEWVWPYRESDVLGGFDPYSNSKACSELVTSSYRSSFFSKTQTVRVSTARAGNVIGGGDWAMDRLIPDIVRAHTKKEELHIRYPKSIRPWQHVLESLSGYLKLAEHLYASGPDYQESWNFGPGSHEFVTVEDILNFIQKDIPQVYLKYRVTPSPLHEAGILKLDNSLATEKLDWKSTWNYQEAIRKTFEWYLALLEGKSAAQITKSQIQEYMAHR